MTRRIPSRVSPDADHREWTFESFVKQVERPFRSTWLTSRLDRYDHDLGECDEESSIFKHVRRIGTDEGQNADKKNFINVNNYQHRSSSPEPINIKNIKQIFRNVVHDNRLYESTKAVCVKKTCSECSVSSRKHRRSPTKRLRANRTSPLFIDRLKSNFESPNDSVPCLRTPKNWCPEFLLRYFRNSQHDCEGTDCKRSRESISKNYVPEKPRIYSIGLHNCEKVFEEANMIHKTDRNGSTCHFEATARNDSFNNLEPRTNFLHRCYKHSRAPCLTKNLFCKEELYDVWKVPTCPLPVSSIPAYYGGYFPCEYHDVMHRNDKTEGIFSERTFDHSMQCNADILPEKIVRKFHVDQENCKNSRSPCKHHRERRKNHKDRRNHHFSYHKTNSRISQTFFNRRSNPDISDVEDEISNLTVEVDKSFHTSCRFREADRISKKDVETQTFHKKRLKSRRNKVEEFQNYGSHIRERNDFKLRHEIDEKFEMKFSDDYLKIDKIERKSKTNNLPFRKTKNKVENDEYSFLTDNKVLQNSESTSIIFANNSTIYINYLLNERDGSNVNRNKKSSKKNKEPISSGISTEKCSSKSKNIETEILKHIKRRIDKDFERLPSLESEEITKKNELNELIDFSDNMRILKDDKDQDSSTINSETDKSSDTLTSDPDVFFTTEESLSNELHEREVLHESNNSIFLQTSIYGSGNIDLKNSTPETSKTLNTLVQSIDSGVVTDCSLNDLHISKSLIIADVDVKNERDTYFQIDKISNYNFNVVNHSGNFPDEDIEKAIQRFTDNLVLCERRAYAKLKLLKQEKRQKRLKAMNAYQIGPFCNMTANNKISYDFYGFPKSSSPYCSDDEKSISTPSISSFSDSEESDICSFNKESVPRNIQALMGNRKLR